MGDLGSPGWEGEEWRMLSPTERTRFDSMRLPPPSRLRGARSGGGSERRGSAEVRPGPRPTPLLLFCGSDRRSFVHRELFGVAPVSF